MLGKPIAAKKRLFSNYLPHVWQKFWCLNIYKFVVVISAGHGGERLWIVKWFADAQNLSSSTFCLLPCINWHALGAKLVLVVKHV